MASYWDFVSVYISKPSSYFCHLFYFSQEIISACDNALKSGKLKPGECVRLMYPMGKMLSLMPPPNILPRLEPILTPYLRDMQETVGQPPSPQTKAKISFQLKILMTLFQTLDIRPRDDERAEAQVPFIYYVSTCIAQNWGFFLSKQKNFSFNITF